MHQYFIKTPWLVKQFFKSYTWQLPADDDAVYITFDDGPHPLHTTWILDVLKEHKAQATFFCIGKNVVQHPHVYKRIIAEGHRVGNHTYNHYNGWKTPVDNYIADVSKASTVIESDLFRPPYGRIKKAQAKRIKTALKNNETRIIMWDVLSADFDASITNEQCLQNVLNHIEAGSIIVFHDSEKAAEKVRYVLPKVLLYVAQKGWMCKRIE